MVNLHKFNLHIVNELKYYNKKFLDAELEYNLFVRKFPNVKDHIYYDLYYKKELYLELGKELSALSVEINQV